MTEAQCQRFLLELLTKLAQEGVLPAALADAEVALDVDLRTLGVDSLGLMSFLSAVESRLELNLPERRLGGLRSLGDLARLLCELSSQAA